jgi:hypothetical protein
MIELFPRVSRNILLMVFIGALIAVVSLWISWKVALSYSEVGQSHIKLDRPYGIVYDPPLDRLPSSYDFISIDIKLHFIPLRSTEYQDVFQIGGLDTGMRLELSPKCEISLIARTLEGSSTILLGRCEFNHPYKLQMAFDENGVFRGIANDEALIGHHQVVKLIPEFGAFVYQNGKRPFLGEVLELDLRATFFKQPSFWLRTTTIIAVTVLAVIGSILAYFSKLRFSLANAPFPHRDVRAYLWRYWFVCSLGLVGIIYGISREFKLSLFMNSELASYNRWALPWVFPAKPRELIFVAGVWISLFLYYVVLHVLVPKAGWMNEVLKERVANRKLFLFAWGLSFGINALIFAWFRGKNNTVISVPSFVLVLVWIAFVAWPFFVVVSPRGAALRSSLMFQRLIERANQWGQSRKVFVSAVCVLSLISLHFGFIFFPFVRGDLKIINEYLDIPEYTYLGETQVSNTEYINDHQLGGLNKYDPMLDRGRTPTPMPGMYALLPKTDVLDSFINEHNTAYYYNDNLHALVLNRGMTSEEYNELDSIYLGAEHRELVHLLQSSRSVHRALMRKDYTSTEMEFFKKNRFEMHNQILNRWVIHHHNFVLGPINEYVRGKPLKDINAQYGPLNVVIMANILEWTGGISYENYFQVWYWVWLIYFSLFVLCVGLIFRDVFYVTLVCVLAFAYIIMIDFQFLSLGPGLNPIRHFFDVAVLAALCMFIRKRKVGFLVAAVMCALLGLLNNIQFGLALAVALGATLIIMAVLDREILSLRTAVVCGGFAVLLLLGIALFVSAPGSAKNSMLTYYLSGWVGPPLSVNHLVWTMMAVSAAYLCLVYFESSAKDIKYISMLLLFYSQGLFLYYTWGSTPPHILNIAPILVLCAVGFLKIFLEGIGAEGFQRLIAIVLIVISICAVYIPGSFAYYSAKQTFDNVFVDHKTYQWTLKTANFKSTMDPHPFLDSVSLIKEFTESESGVYIISKYDNFIPFLAEKYSAMPFFDVPWFLITAKEIDLCIERLVKRKPPYIYVDTDIDRSLNGDIVVGKFPIEGNYEDGIGIESRMRVERLDLLKTIYAAIRDDYEPVKKGVLLTAYKRKV